MNYYCVYWMLMRLLFISKKETALMMLNELTLCVYSLFSIIEYLFISLCLQSNLQACEQKYAIEYST